MNKAHYIKSLRGFRGQAALYKLIPPMKVTEDGINETHIFVVVSAAEPVPFQPETYIFPADATGEVTSWGSLPGSISGTLNHSAALNGAGYEID